MAKSKQKAARTPKKQTLHARSATPVDRHVGLQIRAARLEINMSQEDLANALGITFQQVQKYEKGLNRVSVGRLVDAAEVLGKPLTYFTPMTNELGERELDEIGDAETRALISTFVRIEDPDVRRRVVAVVRAIASGAS